MGITGVGAHKDCAMLGLGGSGRQSAQWQWHISGKHPAAGDFFAIGPKSPMTEAFSGWMRRGAEQLVIVSKELLTRSCSWRFWAKTPDRGMLACGVVRNSCDSARRPFPLLLMGTGRLEKWEKNWDFLPFACEGIWRRLEQLAAKNYASLSQLQEDVLLLRPPQSNWAEMDSARREILDRQVMPGWDGIAASFVGTREIFLPLRTENMNDLFTLISHLHFFLKEKINAVPNSLFLGGLMEHATLALFQRPLSRADFEQMWSNRSQAPHLHAISPVHIDLL